MIVANSICIIGAGLLVGLPTGDKWGRIVALWLCYFQGLGFSMSLTMVSSNVAGYTKKQLTVRLCLWSSRHNFMNQRLTTHCDSLGCANVHRVLRWQYYRAAGVYCKDIAFEMTASY